MNSQHKYFVENHLENQGEFILITPSQKSSEKGYLQNICITLSTYYQYYSSNRCLIFKLNLNVKKF